MKDALAATAAVIWFALNIVLWILRLPDLVQFACALALGVVFVAGFFGYLTYRERDQSRRSKDSCDGRAGDGMRLGAAHQSKPSPSTATSATAGVSYDQYALAQPS